MVFIHGHTAKPALPEMACQLQSGMNMPGIGAMHFRQSAPYAIAVLRRQDQVEVIWHEHPGPDADVRRLAMPGQQVSIEVIIEVTKKCLCAAIAALRDMVGNAGDDSARQTSHGPNFLQLVKVSVKKCTVTVIRNSNRG